MLFVVKNSDGEYLKGEYQDEFHLERAAWTTDIHQALVFTAGFSADKTCLEFSPELPWSVRRDASECRPASVVVNIAPAQ